MMNVKIQFGNDIRRWRYPEAKRYESLIRFVVKTFNFPDEGSFFLQFEDDEGDRLTLTSENDFEDAFSCAEQENKKSLKIFIIQGSIEDSHKLSDQPTSRASSFEAEKKQEIESVITVEKPVEKPEEKEEDTSCCCASWREVALDFLQNKEIKNLLPEFVRCLLVELRKQQSSNSTKNVLTIITEVLSEEKFKPIVMHDAYKKKIAQALPWIADKIQSHQYLLFTFNEDAIVSWVPHVIEILIRALSQADLVDFNMETNPMFHGIFPNLFSCMNGAPWMNGQCRMSGTCWMNDHPFMHGRPCMNDARCMNNASCMNKERIHHNVTCDGCNVSPISGVRYKCCVCRNFDLCSKCQSSGKHDASHPLIQFSHPIGSCNFSYLGLHEINRALGGKRCGRFSHCKAQVEGHQFRHERRSHHQPHHHEPHHHGPHHHGPHHHEAHHQFHHRFHHQKMDAEFITDVTIPDGSYYPVNTILSKIWKVRNCGPTQWNNVELVFFKGNESLALEKRYPVPNAKPGEEVDIFALIKTPSKSGRYCTYFRLQHCGNFFGASLWVDLITIDDDEESKQENQSKENIEKKKPDVSISSTICKCGASLIHVLGADAYHQGATIYCDICGKQVSSNEMMYHCPTNNDIHPRGYDCCETCVVTQISIVNQVKGKSISPELPMELQSEDEQEVMVQHEAVIKPRKVEDEQPKQEPKEEPKENLQFSNELKILQDMGFEDLNTLKSLLVKHKGDIERVIQEFTQI